MTTPVHVFHSMTTPLAKAPPLHYYRRALTRSTIESRSLDNGINHGGRRQKEVNMSHTFKFWFFFLLIITLSVALMYFLQNDVTQEALIFFSVLLLVLFISGIVWMFNNYSYMYKLYRRKFRKSVAESDPNDCLDSIDDLDVEESPLDTPVEYRSPYNTIIEVSSEVGKPPIIRISSPVSDNKTAN